MQLCLFLFNLYPDLVVFCTFLSFGSWGSRVTGALEEKWSTVKVDALPCPLARPPSLSRARVSSAWEPEVKEKVDSKAFSHHPPKSGWKFKV